MSDDTLIVVCSNTVFTRNNVQYYVIWRGLIPHADYVHVVAARVQRLVVSLARCMVSIFTALQAAAVRIAAYHHY